MTAPNWPEKCPVCARDLAWWKGVRPQKYCVGDGGHSTGHFGIILEATGMFSATMIVGREIIQFKGEDFERWLKLRAFQ